MKKHLLLFVAVLLCATLHAQTGEQQLNSEYQAAIREFIQQDIANRQRTMQRRAEQLLIALPNEQKLYDETYISIRTALVPGSEIR